MSRIPYVTEGVVDVSADVNSSLKEIDGLVSSRAVSLVTAPPASPSDGDRYAVRTGSTGLFAGKGGQLAVYIVTGDFYEFYEPVEVVVDNTLYISSGGNWVANAPDVDVSNIAGLQDALDSKVDAEAGKVMTDNNFSDVSKNKLEGISEGANKTTVVQVKGTSLTSVISQRGMADHYLDKDAMVNYLSKEDFDEYSQYKVFENDYVGSGFLIKTDIAVSEGAGGTTPAIVDIRAISVGSIPLDVSIYTTFSGSTFQSLYAYSSGRTLSGLRVFFSGGFLCVWFPPQGSFSNLMVFSPSISTPSNNVKNRVVSLTDEVMPAGAESITEVSEGDNVKTLDTGSVVVGADKFLMEFGTYLPEDLEDFLMLQTKEDMKEFLEVGGGGSGGEMTYSPWLSGQLALSDEYDVYRIKTTSATPIVQFNLPVGSDKSVLLLELFAEGTGNSNMQVTSAEHNILVGTTDTLVPRQTSSLFTFIKIGLNWKLARIGSGYSYGD